MSTISVATDANLLINLMHTSRLSLLGQLVGYQFLIPDAVEAEITVDDQQQQLSSAFGSRAVVRCWLTGLDALSEFAALRATLGAGESACLVLAELNGWHIASDERKAFRREVVRRVGEGRLLTTLDIYLLLIRASALTVAEADADKAILASRRFIMKGFASFGELIPSDS